MAIEVIGTLKPKNNGTFPIAEAKDIDVNGTRLDEKLNEIGQGGSGGGSGGGIIDVTELPTKNINESAVYRLNEVVTDFYLGQIKQFYGRMRCICVDRLPTTGEACYDPEDPKVVAYYNKTDGVVYGYVTSSLSSVMGVSVGWYPAVNLFSALGKNFGGVIHSISEATDPETFYLYVLEMPPVYYAAKNGVWTRLAGDIKMEFNSITDFVMFAINNPRLRYVDSNINVGGLVVDGSYRGFGFEILDSNGNKTGEVRVTGIVHFSVVAEISAEGTFGAASVISFNYDNILRVNFLYVQSELNHQLTTKVYYSSSSLGSSYKVGDFVDLNPGETITAQFSVV